MQVVRGYKTELDLNNEQRTACLKHAGCARFACNWGLARSQEVYRPTGKRPTPIDPHKELFYPSSQLCSNCQWRNEALTLADRVFVCQDCGAVTDRDYNAAQNIRRVAVSSIDTQNVCRQRGAGSYSGMGETTLVEAGTNQHGGMSTHV